MCAILLCKILKTFTMVYTPIFPKLKIHLIFKNNQTKHKQYKQYKQYKQPCIIKQIIKLTTQIKKYTMYVLFMECNVGRYAGGMFSFTLLKLKLKLKIKN